MQANCMFKQKCYAKLNAVTFSLFTQVDVSVHTPTCAIVLLLFMTLDEIVLDCNRFSGMQVLHMKALEQNVGYCNFALI